MPRKQATAAKVDTTRGKTITIEIHGRAVADLEDVAGDRPLSEVDEDAEREKCLRSLEGAECHGVDLDGIPFTLYLHVS